MKKILTIVFLSLCAVAPLFAQTIKKIRKVVPVLTEQTFYLNGGTRAAFGGKSRVWYPVTLPPNTVEWYFSFTSERGKDASATVNLLSQLTRACDPTGTTALAVQSLASPTGSAACDIYLMDRTNADKFMDKVDNTGGTYSYFINGSRLNFKNGVVQVKDLTTGTYYLGFKNPSGVEGINVTFEVSAIVEETLVIEQTENEKKAEMYAELGWKAYERGEFEKCIEWSKKALKADPKIHWVYNNIALVHLIKGNQDAAIAAYTKAIRFFKASPNKTQWFEAAILDLTNLIQNKNPNGAADMLELLKMEAAR